jgi:hypothetical protein
MANKIALPASIGNSTILTTVQLKQLCSVPDLPFIDPSFEDDRLKNIIQYFSNSPDEMERELHLYAKELLDKGNINAAWQVLLTVENV